MRLSAAAVLCSVLAVLAQQAAAQCPSNNICQARFDNLPGGPVDCCKWDYTKGKCFWGSTPVSWTRVRVCNQEGKNYEVLTQSNFQGPPGASAECRCANAQAASPSFPSVLQACVAMKAHKDVDIVGNDIPCKANAFCQVCGGLEAVKEGCLQNNRCVAFSFDYATGCGYLKSAPYTSERKGWVVYARAG